MPLPLSTIVADPDWIPHAIDPSGANLTFVHVPRAARSDLTFLSDEHYKGQFAKEAYPFASVAAALGNIDPRPPHYIFHSSFCCSTLLAKALDVPGKTVSLREPDILLHLANRVIQSGDAANKAQIDLVLRLLSRPYSPGEIVIVKPSNLANRLLAPILAGNRRSRAVLLYSDLPTLLRSLTKKGIWGRIFGRQVYRNLAGWTQLRLGFGPVETFDQTDLQIAALAWLMHIHQFNQVASQFGPDRVMLLKSADFLDDVPATLARAAGFFGLNLEEDAVRAIAAGPVFAGHSKLSQAYSAEERARDHSAADAAYGAEIEMVLKWIAVVADHAGMPLQPALLAG